ncbi:restriction endonuclease subunit S [Acinetobacter sp. SWBY1]|nr:restriction endonuclease subunit S [Acinetobacter sp. SWBY1]AVH48861.1 restriction endonuclease subunit S [Acinetobacter sp. SWBY1]
MSVPKLRFKEFTPEYNEYELKTLLKSYRLGGNYSNSESKTNYPLIKMGNLNRGSINLSKIEYIPEDELIDSQDIIQFGDLFFNTRNTLDLVGKVAIWRNELPIAYYNSNLLKLEFENNFYMNFLLNTEKSLEKLKAIASGTTSVAAIYTKDLLKVKIRVPHVEEQTKIASFLSAVDEKISQLTQKHELLSQYKQGMMQKLFSQQLRFKADDGSEFGEWDKLVFDKFIIERSIISKNESTPLYSLTIENGVTAKSERYEREFLVKDTGNAYKEVHPLDFVMNPMNLRFGAIGQNFENKIVKLSKYYNVFYLDQNIVKDYYFLTFAKSKLMIDFYNQMSTGSLIEKRRNHFKDFLKYEHYFPCLEEQTKIAQFLSTIDQKIEVVAQQIEQAKTWKKGLLQQMFV